jgi:hypothetical protein
VGGGELGRGQSRHAGGQRGGLATYLRRER